MSETFTDHKSGISLGQISTASGLKFAALFARIGRENERDEAAWIAAMRSAGVMAAHPDDGWVDRQRNAVRFTYPQFNCSPQIGDRIALGSHRAFRIVCVTDIEYSRFFRDELGPMYLFKDAPSC